MERDRSALPDMNQGLGAQTHYDGPAVPLYFFHLYNDIVSMDEEGVDLPDLEAARANGIREAREMMLETVAEGRINLSHRIDIADESGAVVDSVAFGEAVTVEG
jgi:hypothetical protein